LDEYKLIWCSSRINLFVPGRTEINVFLKIELALFFYKNNKVSNMRQELKNKDWESVQKYTVKNTFGHSRVSWSKSIEAFCWRIIVDQHYAIGVLQHCAKASSACQSGSLFLTILDSFLNQEYVLIDCKFVKHLKDCIVLG